MNLFNEILAEALRQKGMTQRELAERIGVSEPMVGRYISGTQIPKWTIVVRIAEVLGVSTETLEAGNGEETKMKKVYTAERYEKSGDAYNTTKDIFTEDKREALESIYGDMKHLTKSELKNVSEWVISEFTVPEEYDHEEFETDEEYLLDATMDDTYRTWDAGYRVGDENAIRKELGYEVEEDEGSNAEPNWYAIMRDREDDWGTGSVNYDEAVRMLNTMLPAEEYPDRLIAVIDPYNVCIEEITEF